VVAGGSRAGIAQGPGGGVVAGGSRAGVAAGPGGAVAGGSRAGVAAGPGGNVVAGGSRAGVAAGPGGAVAGGSRVGVAAGPGGAVAGGSRAGVAAGPYGSVAGRRAAIAGVGAAGAFVGTRYVGGAALRNQGAYVRRGFGYYNAFNPGWYARHPGAWALAGWTAAQIWGTATWDTASSFVGYGEATSPMYYDYGSSVTYQDGQVYYGDQPVATEEQYAEQAIAIAEAAPAEPDPAAAKADDWQPLGVFALVKGDEHVSNDVFQLALDGDGVVRGNYYNAVADQVTPVSGSLDKKTQRVAWRIGDKRDTVYETGLYNLTLAESSILAHFGTDRTEQYTLVRVEQPDGQDGAAPGQE
jgi:hypothetical protein